MTEQLAITPIAPFEAVLTPPGSKSLTNRAMLLAALADGESTLHRPLWADDTLHLLHALGTLGFHIVGTQGDSTLRITGRGGQIPVPGGTARVHIGNAGTACRFLTAALALADGTCEVDGVPRMRERPIGALVEPLRRLGAEIVELGETGFPPLRITGRKLTGGQLELGPTLSSQYISALLQIGPMLESGLELRFTAPIISRPYVEMTLATMKRFGIEAATDTDLTRIAIPPGRYRATTLTIEPDASNASYFLAAAAILPGSRCTIEGLGRDSIQGDVGFAEVLGQMGAAVETGPDTITITGPPRLQGVDVDLNAMPDMAQTLAVVALFADGPTVIRGIGNLRVKETDRLKALRCELEKLGAQVRIDGPTLHITPPADPRLQPATIATYDDHRMAMSFAIAGLRSEGVTIADPGCVAKTFPEYFKYLARLGDCAVGPRP